MFEVSINENTKLVLVHHALAEEYAKTVEANRAYLSEWLEWPRHCKTTNAFADFIRDSLHKYADGKSMVCAIFHKDELVGNCGFNTINHQIKKAEIGYWLAESHQGRGIMTSACQFLIDYAFNELKLEKVEIAAAEHNRPSRAVCERLGLKLEGILTNRELIGGKILNHAIYGIHNKTLP